MKFKTYQSYARRDIEDTLDAYLSEWIERAERLSNFKLSAELNQLSKSVSGGKRVRGVMVKLGYDMTGVPGDKEIIKPAAAYEILHASLLMHDDIIDKGLRRRAKPTVYKALGENHYAISQSISLGNMGFFLATNLITQSGFDKNKINEVIATISQIIIDTAIGQMLDVKLALPEETKLQSDIEAIQKNKTAKYTVTGPLMIGAILGGGSERTLEAIKGYGLNLGIAFQIKDDILGVFGEQKTIGKSVKSDIEENKNTLLIVHALENSSNSHKNYLKKHYGKGKISADEHRKIMDIFVESGSLDYSVNVAKKSVLEGKKYIDLMTKDTNFRQILDEMADYMIARKS